MYVYIHTYIYIYIYSRSPSSLGGVAVSSDPAPDFFRCSTFISVCSFRGKLKQATRENLSLLFYLYFLSYFYMFLHCFVSFLFAFENPSPRNS